jgi:hypothetical protein
MHARLLKSATHRRVERPCARVLHHVTRTSMQHSLVMEANIRSLWRSRRLDIGRARGENLNYHSSFQPVWTKWRSENSWPYRDSNPDLSVVQTVEKANKIWLKCKSFLKQIIKTIKRIESLKNTVNKYMADIGQIDLRPVKSEWKSVVKSTTKCIIGYVHITKSKHYESTQQT